MNSFIYLVLTKKNSSTKFKYVHITFSEKRLMLMVISAVKIDTMNFVLSKSHKQIQWEIYIHIKVLLWLLHTYILLWLLIRIIWDIKACQIVKLAIN